MTKPVANRREAGERRLVGDGVGADRSGAEGEGVVAARGSGVAFGWIGAGVALAGMAAPTVLVDLPQCGQIVIPPAA